MAAVAQSAAANAVPLSVASGGRVVPVGPEYCSPYPLVLAMEWKSFFGSENFVVTDVSNDNLLFRVEPFGSSKTKVRIVNAAGVHILTLKPKAWSWSGRWQVFRGESNHLICSVKSSVGFFRSKKKVYLANNTTENHCDFIINKGFLEESYVVYDGESKAAKVAEIHEHIPLSEKGKFMLTIQSNIDQAFIVALTVILDAMNSSSDGGDGGGDDGDGGGDGGDSGGGDGGDGGGGASCGGSGGAGCGGGGGGG